MTSSNFRMSDIDFKIEMNSPLNTLNLDLIPTVPIPQATVPETQEKKDKPTFLQELLAICCGVISPRSLNGLNHCNLDNDFHTANQEQNISMLLKKRP